MTPSGRADGRELVKQRDAGVRPHQVQAHQDGKREAHEHAEQRQEVILNANHLVVEAEDVFPDEALGRLVPVNCFRVRFCHQ